MALRTPPLRAVHGDTGARFTEFGGWEMPVQFTSIREEHAAVREAAGKFDVSHMGRIVVAGADATALMQRLTTNDVTALAPGDAQYAMITDEEGVIIDDTVVYRLPEGSGEMLPSDSGREAIAAASGPRYLFVPNAGHDAQMLDRWRSHREKWGLDAAVVDATESSAMIAVQGPEATDLLTAAATTAAELAERGRFEVTEATVAGVDCLASRTGYTGEDGFEVLCTADDAERLWTALECQACGLGARDTLRMEMGFLLSGQDFDPETEPRTPYEAGVGFAVDLETEFVGRDALARVRETGVDETFVGVTLRERGVPRSGYEFTDTDGEPIGHVTSGTVSPTLGEPIGLGYLPVGYADPGTAVDVVIRGEPKRATVTELPFLER